VTIQSINDMDFDYLNMNNMIRELTGGH